MTESIKSQDAFLRKLNIDTLNAMQEESMRIFPKASNIQLCSPTGTGKTLAFLLPIILSLDPAVPGVQVLILVPSRELAMQIEQVARDMGSGFKVNAVYGGQSISKDKLNLKHPPSILIGTPGRIMDHLRRNTVSVEAMHTLVLDEFDKSLEVGFEEQMEEILEQLKNLKKRILTSATDQIEIPNFVQFTNPICLNFESDIEERLTYRIVISPDKDKLETLLQLLHHIADYPGIIFCNYKESIQRVSEYLLNNSVAHGCFHGGLDQMDRERALIKFRNGTHRLLVATDLAARGLDIPAISFIIHYHLPHKVEEFIHRNGRTARVQESGVIYILKWEDQDLPDYVPDGNQEKLEIGNVPPYTGWSTLIISGGRKDKISKGDIAGLFLKKGSVQPEQLGVIELKQDCAFVGIVSDQVENAISRLDNTRLKSKKIRIKLI